MFQDALMESGGKITTKSRYFSVLGVVINGIILLALILWPLLHPLALPKQALAVLLVAPSPPLAHAPIEKAAASSNAARPEAFSAQLLMRSKMHAPVNLAADAAPSSDGAFATGAMPGATASSNFGDLFKGTATAPRPSVQAAIPKKIAISSGVMAGNKISGANPTYPAIARAARIQGTVAIAATISKAGTIENLRVVSGPPMLSASALEAVKNWRYKPYLLNGEPVEVETSIQVVFNLGD